MKPKPQGRERDRQIAELKGFDVTYIGEDDGQTWKIKSDYYYHPPKMELTWRLIPHYSTSLTDAWELWEEMKKEVAVSLECYSGNTFCCWETKPRIWDDFNGKDEADAISGAWVMWRGEK